MAALRQLKLGPNFININSLKIPVKIVSFKASNSGKMYTNMILSDNIRISGKTELIKNSNGRGFSLNISKIDAQKYIGIYGNIRYINNNIIALSVPPENLVKLGLNNNNLPVSTQKLVNSHELSFKGYITQYKKLVSQRV